MSNGYGSGKDTRQTALRDLYVKLGGNIADVAEENDINRLIRDLGNVAGGGGGAGALIVHVINGTLDKTWKEISDAVESGSVTALYDGNASDRSIFCLSYVGTEEGNYMVVFIDFSSGSVVPLVCVATAEDGYPAIQS